MKKNTQKTNIFVKAAVVTFVCFCLISIVQLQINYNEMSAQKAASEAKISALNDSIEELEDELARPFDDDYVKEIARSKLNYRMPEEIIFYNDLVK
ncbi:MAG: septum formation initiator family protein [Eubacteriales bacterium]